MDFENSDLSQPKSCVFIVLNSQDDSQVTDQGEKNILTSLPGLKMEKPGPSRSVTTTVQASPAKKGKSPGAEVLRRSLGREDNSSDDEKEGVDDDKTALERVTDTGSEADFHLIPCSQKLHYTVSESELQSDTDGGARSNSPVNPRQQALNKSSSSDDADRTLKAASKSDTSTADETIKPKSSGLSSDRYKLGSSVEKETRTEVKDSKKIEQAYSPKDLFTVPDSEEEERHCVLTPSEHIGSLQLSQSVFLVPESQEQQSLGHVPPSLDAYGLYPVIIPSSPTDHSSEKDSCVEEVTVYKPEELSTLASNGEQSKSIKDNSSRSLSSSRSDKQSSSSSDKSNGDTGGRVKSWQPMTMLSPEEYVVGEGTVKSASRKLHLSHPTREPEQSEVITAGVSRFIPTLSEHSTGDSDSLKLKLSASHTEDDRSNSTAQGDSPLKQAEEAVSEYMDSQHVALHLSPSQPESSGPDSALRKESQKQKSLSQPQSMKTKQLKVKTVSSSDPTCGVGGKKVGKSTGLIEAQPAEGADTENDPIDKPLSSTPEDFLLGEKPAHLKPSLSLSMIDVHDEEDSSIYSFKLTRPNVQLPVETPAPQGESLFKKGLSPQKRHKRPMPDDSIEEESFQVLPSSGKKTFREKPQTSKESPGLLIAADSQTLSQKSQARKSQKSEELELSEPESVRIVVKEKAVEDPDETIPLEETSYGNVGRTSMDKSETGKLESQKDREKSLEDEETQSYRAESFTRDKKKNSQETSSTITVVHQQESSETRQPSSSISMAPDSTKRPASSSSRPHDPYEFIGSQSQNVSAPIKDPNTTPVTMPKCRGKPSTAKKRRKKTLAKVHVTRVRPGTKTSEAAPESSSSEYDKAPGRENVGFSKHPSIIRRSTGEGQIPPVRKTVRLSVGTQQTQPMQSTSMEVTANPAPIRLNVSDSTASSTCSSQSTVRRKIIVTTKKRFLYEHRLITIEEWRDGKMIFSHTKEENEEPVLEKESVTTHEEKEMLSPGASPSRSTSTVTSGDLGDISSSLSRSSSHGSKSSSGGGTFDRMHSSLDRTPSLGTLSSHDDPSLPLRLQSVHSVSSQKSSVVIGGDLPKNQPVTSTIKETIPVAKGAAVHCGSDVLFTSSDQEKFDNSKHVSRELDGSQMELSPIVDEHQTPPVAITQKQAADSSDDNRISGGKTQTVIVSPEISSSLGERQTSGGFIVTDPVIRDQERSDSGSTPRTTRIRAAKTPRSSRKGKSAAKSASSDEIPIEKKRKAANPKPSTSAGPSTSKKSRTLLDTSATSDDISPEIPNQAPEATGLVADKAEYTRVTPDNVNSHKGSLVIAKWKDGFYYPGELLDCRSNEKCMVHFDDGDKLLVRLADVIITDRLSIGQSVLVESSDGGFDPGLVIGYYGRGKTLSYTIERDDAVTKNYIRDKVILSADQAGIILGETPALSTPVPALNTSAADVSLENLVEGKRRTRRDPVSELKSAAKGSSSKTTSTKGKKRKQPAFEPTTTSTPTPKQGRRTIRQAEAVTPRRSKKLGGIVESPLTVKRSPRKVRTELFDSAKGPMPADRHLFEGMVFLLTHVEKTKEQKKAEKKLLAGSSFETSTDESAVDEEVSVPFDKEHLKAQIEAGGGTVLSRFDITKVTGESNCYLISDSYQRTVKYFQCLAAGIMCVSHVWVRDSSKQDVLLDPGSYVLPAGVNIDTNRVMECGRRNPLVGLAVSVVSLSREFREAWVSILETSGCVVTAQLSTEVTVDPDLGAVVADCTCPGNFITKSEKANVPVVSSEWVIQCLIRGEFLDTSSNLHFHPHFSES